MSKTSPFNYYSNPDIAAIQASIALKANIASPTFTGIVTLPGNPSTDLGAATKSYVDAGLQGLSPKPAPAVATTTTLPAYSYNNGSSGVGATITMTATGVVAIDGRNLVLNDLVLVKNEIAGNAPYNGLFDVTIAGAVGVALVLRRNTSMDISTEFSGAYLLVNGGTINAGSGWWCTNASAPTIGTTAITFSQFNGASSVTAGTGLVKVGNTLSIDSTVATLTGSQALTNKTINGLTPTALATGFTLAGGTTSKTLTVPLDASVSGTNTGDQTTVSGNAGTATALQTARTIGGVSFDGTANTTVASATGGFTVSGGDLAVGANNITGTGSLGATASRLTKGWFIDFQVTNAIAGSITGSAPTLTTARAIYGNNFDGSAALTQVIASTYGGTGNGFAKLSGPASTEKTFTLPNASAAILTDNALVTAAQGGTNNGFTQFTGPTSSAKTFTLPNASASILTDNAAVTVPQGGTGLTTLTTAYGVVCAGTTATGVLQNAGAGTSGQILTSNGASAIPSFQTPQFQYLGRLTASSSTSLSQTLGSGKTYYFYFTSIVPSVSGTMFTAQYSSNGGSTIINTSYLQANTFASSSDAPGGVTNKTTGLSLTGSDGNSQTCSINTANKGGINGLLRIYNPSASINQQADWETFYRTDTNSYQARNYGSGVYTGATAAINYVQFLFKTTNTDTTNGNIVSGFIDVFVNN